MATIEIGMIGPKGAGKTSLLAAMHNAFEALEGSRVRLVATDRDDSGTTATYLDAATQDLKNIARGIFDIPEGIPPNTEGRELEFEIKSVRGHRYGRLHWTDYPGELLFPPVGGSNQVAKRSKLMKQLHGSRSVLVAVDAPAAMWQSGRLNDQINLPSATRSLLDQWIDAKGEKKLVIFCPIKCEKWVQTPDDRKELEAAIKEVYNPLLNAWRERSSKPKVFYMPVQTVGSLRHITFREEEPGVYRSEFAGEPGMGFAPKWVANPLKAVLVEAAREISDMESLWDFLTGENHGLNRQKERWKREGFGESVSQWI